MSRRLLAFPFPVALALATVSPASASHWSNDAEINNPIAVEHSRQQNCVAVSDGCGGAIVAWQDLRNELYYYIYAQRINANGDVLWTVNGVKLSTENSNQRFPRIVSDDAGGAIVIWDDQRADVSDLYAQRIDANGNVLWNPAGVPIAVAANSQTDARAIPDGFGGAIVCWRDSRTDADVYAQRVDALGNVLWTANGEPVSTAVATQESPELATDGMGGAVIAWTDSRNDPINTDVYAQRMLGDGSPAWTVNGIPVAAAAFRQRNPAVSYSMGNGAYIVWEDFRDGVDYHIYGQRLLGDATGIYAAGGIKVSALAGGANIEPQIVPGESPLSGSAGRTAYVLWRHLGGGGEQELILSYLSLTDFLPIEIEIDFGSGDKLNPHLAHNPSDGGVLISWTNNRYGTPDVFVTKFYGNFDFPEAGNSICTAFGSQGPARVVSDLEGGAVLVWDDYREGVIDPDIYAQRIDFTSTLGYSSPDITGITDNPQDQGKEVVVTWTRSRIDIPSVELQAQYSVWRRNQNPAAAFGFAPPAADVLKARLATARAAGIGARLASEQVGAGWELVGTTPQVHLPAYAMTAPTYGDSTGAGIPYTGFLVVYETEIGHFKSASDSAYSVDDLAPEAIELEGTTVGLDAQLDWMIPPASPDVVAYNLYRSAAPGVAVEPGNLIVTVPDLTYLDGTTGGITHYYVVTAIDDADQEGPPSNEVAVPQGSIGTPTTPPAVLSVRAAGANPVRERARFLFGLPAEADVAIAVYDVSGRRVLSEAVGSRPAGWHAYEFAGHDAWQRRVESGVYFLEVRAGSSRRVARFVMLP